MREVDTYAKRCVMAYLSVCIPTIKPESLCVSSVMFYLTSSG